jgi:TDG/mug DNA glycosylase family protein
MDVLPDILAPNLRVVFCGTAVGAASARRSAYYAGPGNKFWRTLHTIGLTPRVLLPSEYAELLQYRIGLTDLAKRTSGADSTLGASDFDVDGLEDRIRRCSPSVLCFNGKRAASTFLRRNAVEFGLATERIGNTRLFIAPSTSGAANGYWDLAVWKQLVTPCLE